MRVIVLLVIAQIGLAAYALRSVCAQIGRDRRCPSHNRVMALRAAYWSATGVMLYALIMWGTSDGHRYVIVMDWVAMGCLASSLVAALAIRMLQGDGDVDRQ